MGWSHCTFTYVHSIKLKNQFADFDIYIYEHAIIGTREENPVISGVSELVPFSF